jgi:hypothetical protein
LPHAKVAKVAKAQRKEESLPAPIFLTNRLSCLAGIRFNQTLDKKMGAKRWGHQDKKIKLRLGVKV